MTHPPPASPGHPSTPAALRWAATVAEFERSGLSLRAFAARHQLNASTFAWWRSRLRQASLRSPRFQAVEVHIEPAAPSPAPLRIELAGGSVVLVVPPDANLDQLRAVVALLA